MPEGFEASRYEPVTGWDIELDAGQLTIEAADGNEGIAPGQFSELRLQAQNPEQPGELRFPALQTYDDGEVAEWIGEQDAEEPAPTMAIGGEATEGGEAAQGEESGGGAPAGLTWFGVALGAVGTVLGATALLRQRRLTSRSSPAQLEQEREAPTAPVR